MEAVTGIKELDAMLRHIRETGSKKVARAAITAALTSMTKTLKSVIDSTPASPAAKRAAKQTIGKRFARGGTSRTGKVTQFVAKTGFTVGQKKAIVARRAAAKAGKSNRRGVGITANNIGWLIFGTRPRETTKKHSTGSGPALFLGVTDKAVAAGSGLAIRAAEEKARSVAAAELRKRS